MAAAAQNRAVSAAFLLALMVTSSWCLASATPAGNAARRLEGSAGGGRLAGQLQALTSGLEKLSTQLHALLQNAAVPDDVQFQLQQVALTFDLARAAFQSVLDGLLPLPDTLSQPQTIGALEGMVHQLAAKLGTFASQLQSPTPAGTCFDNLKADLSTVIDDLISQLVALTLGLPSDEPQALITALNNMRDAVSQVEPCAPGLENLRSNGQGVLDAVGELVVSIQ